MQTALALVFNVASEISTFGSFRFGTNVQVKEMSRSGRSEMDLFVGINGCKYSKDWLAMLTMTSSEKRFQETMLVTVLISLKRRCHDFVFGR